MSVGLKFVKQVDENWRERITFIDGSPYNEKGIRNIDEEEIDTEKSSLLSHLSEVQNELAKKSELADSLQDHLYYLNQELVMSHFFKLSN